LSVARHDGRDSGRVLTWPRRTVGAAVLIVLLAATVVWGVSRLGAWLVVEDPLAPARAVVALGGELPFRAMEAAALYRQGWASEVWLTRPPQGRGQAALRELDIEVPGDEVYNRAVLGRLGVPAGAIRVLSQPAENTAEEVQVIARELRRVGGGPVILVTSKPHSRRVRATWRALVGEGPPAIVRYASADPYDSQRWWRHTRDALAVSREVFGLLNVWAGFPVQPARAGL
jgi:uncharacterized SAM-binding protein YcdF (DUF218 family)